MPDWYAQNDVSLENVRAAYRESISNTKKLFVADKEPAEPGTEWERLLLRKSKLTYFYF